jgi:hypothetical protein
MCALVLANNLGDEHCFVGEYIIWAIAVSLVTNERWKEVEDV